MDAIKARELIERYNQGNCTAEEKLLVEAWEAELEATGEFNADEPGLARWQEEVYARLMEQVGPEVETTPVPVHRVHFMRRWGWAAAVAVLAAGLGAYLLSTRDKSSQPEVAAVNTPDIAPGKNGAVLTLADGSQVELDSLGNGVIATQNGAKVRLQNGQVVYDETGEPAGTAFNTMTTPRGRQFRITLPDDTKVWLNAASSLRYPTAFTGKERRVEVTGEAYFEVAKNKDKPFLVEVNNTAEVQVLGTHFNINAYANEPAIYTTLLEGKVGVVSNRQGAMLKPGQQAQISNGIKVADDVDIDKVMAWKNGVFNFEGATLEQFLRQVERWYDIDVEYEKGVPAITFWGKMTRDIPLSGLLVVLQKSNVHFRLEGRKLIVLP
ncbi:FecR domain-containing protein [Chitinophaga sp. YIM B06452]|uniref:FecR family protein n=1 Tax=Chitinophaga sp. YIM B06452 TaxID=3082158 RepID=UPI0031FE6F58